MASQKSTPKEYATELVEEIRKEIYWGVITTADFNPEREKLRKEKAKTVALLSINKTIELQGADESVVGNQIWWWNEVKQEVIKM